MEDISFYPLPKNYKQIMDKINNSIIRRVYSKYSFSINSSLNTKDISNQKKELKRIRGNLTLSIYLKNCQFITYQFRKNIFDVDSSNHEKCIHNNVSKMDAIFCFESKYPKYEGKCLIIDDIDSSLFQTIIDDLKSKKISLIDCCDNSENSLINEEINSFCSHFLHEIRINKFVERTIRPIICYLIRRHFYPSNYFDNPSFFTYLQPKKQKEIELKKRSYDFNYFYINNKKRKEKNINSSILIDQCGSFNDKNENYNDQIKKQVFSKDSFINLRTLYFNERGSIYYLAIHAESLHLFAIKYVNDINVFKYEVDFCLKHSHRCMAQFYGFVEEKRKKIGFVYEFMSNGILPHYDISNNLYSLMTVIRILQVIEYLHSHSLIHRDLKPLNILLDHDNLPYVIDYETIRQPNDNEEMTGDISSMYYISPEQNINKNVSYPTDIYSFGLIIYYLSEKENIGYFKENDKIPSISFGSEIFKDLYKQCVEYNPTKRPTYKDIKLTLTKDFYLSHYIGNYFYNKATKSEARFNAKDIDLMVQFISEIKFLEKPLSNFMVHYYQSQIDLMLLQMQHDDFPSTFRFNYIAKAYFEGMNVDQDYAKAREYYEKSAELDDKNALFKLGEIYYDGLGVQQDYSKAIHYFELAAQQNSEDALERLGIMYLDGIGVEKNAQKAKEYFELEDLINPDTAEYLIKQAFNEKEYANIIKYAKICCGNDPYYFYILGACNEFGIGTKIDFAKAKEYYNLGAQEDDKDCICCLGTVYFKGIGTPKDYLRAKLYYEEAIELNDLNACNYLGFLYLKGFGVKQDFSKAKECYEIAARQNDSKAFYNLGNLYFNGFGVEKNYTTAKKYFEISAKLDNSMAYLKMAEIYRDGNGVLINHSKMIQYYELASQKNNLTAILFLGDLYSTGEIVDINIDKSIQLFNNFLNIYKDSLEKVESCNYMSLEIMFCGYDHIANNDLGLIYITVLQEIEKGAELIKESAFSEYSFAQNNFGLINQYYFDNQIDKAEHEFAMAEYNLGNLYEIEGKTEKSIEFFIKASKHQNSPMIFQNYEHYDKRLEISKKFILCFTNLKLTEYFLNISNYKKSKKYFFRCISLINSSNNEIKYKFKFQSSRIVSKNSFQYIKSFILGFPLFNLFNQPNLNSILEKYKDEISNLNQFLLQNATQNEKNCINCSKDNKINEKENKFDEELLVFEDPKELIDHIIMYDESKSAFIEEIHETILLMKEILYTRPYPILFGRISLEKEHKKTTSTIQDINDIFYKGIGFDI